jgi:sulfoxide reductase heme-binding subunit YedZ
MGILAQSRYIRALLYACGMLPAVWVFYLALTAQLGADPMRTLEQQLGLWALRFLLVTLAITPLRRLGGPNLLRYRRATGLVTFAYATLHLGVYIALDQGFDVAAIGKDILKRPYITIGMLAFAILVPLAITSSNTMIRRLGAPLWTRLHRWVYLAQAAAALHFVLVVKAWPVEPLIYAAIAAALLAFRLVWRFGRRRPAHVSPARA